MYWQRFKTEDEKFWEKVLVGESEDCWAWTGSVTRFGRGTIRFRGKNTVAPKVSYTLMRGDVPDGMKVLHRCDNPNCVNPKHLFLGTQLDNVRDCISKGRFHQNRARPGEAHHFAKLTADEVGSLRTLREQGIHVRTLAAHFGISRSQVYRILGGERWKAT